MIGEDARAKLPMTEFTKDLGLRRAAEVMYRTTDALRHGSWPGLVEITDGHQDQQKLVYVKSGAQAEPKA